ncbi:MAG TPA: hypothetical protein DEF41_07580 [Desulfovibrio sp.]|nr:hypothetical protein [Desulfovibrio sp.]
MYGADRDRAVRPYSANTPGSACRKKCDVLKKSLDEEGVPT